MKLFLISIKENKPSVNILNIKPVGFLSKAPEAHQPREQTRLRLSGKKTSPQRKQKDDLDLLRLSVSEGTSWFVAAIVGGGFIGPKAAENDSR